MQFFLALTQNRHSILNPSIFNIIPRYFDLPTLVLEQFTHFFWLSQLFNDIFDTSNADQSSYND